MLAFPSSGYALTNIIYLTTLPRSIINLRGHKHPVSVKNKILSGFVAFFGFI